MYTAMQGIEAINARINGEWDNEQLMKLGPLMVDPIDDIKEIIKNTFN
jgi:hypothetical protein